MIFNKLMKKMKKMKKIMKIQSKNRFRMKNKQNWLIQLIRIKIQKKKENIKKLIHYNNKIV